MLGFILLSGVALLVFVLLIGWALMSCAHEYPCQECGRMPAGLFEVDGHYRILCPACFERITTEIQ